MLSLFLFNPLEFDLYCRQHAACEQRISISKGSEATRRNRKRRHQMRNVLLVLDYAIELVGGLFMILVVFVGDSLLYQRILYCFGTFLYGIPIPLAYLLNESRVRTIIVKEGWKEGFASIFYSPKKIMDLEREENLRRSTKPGPQTLNQPLLDSSTKENGNLP